MKLFEVVLNKPAVVFGKPNDRDLGFLNDVVNSSYNFTIWKPGQRQENITDPRWTNPSHDWLLSRRSDGVGLLTLRPRGENKVISLIKLGHKPQLMKEATLTINRPGSMHFLLGNVQEGPPKYRHLYKIVVAREDGIDDPFEPSKIKR